MRHYLLFTLLLLSGAYNAHAQCNPKEYARIFNEASMLQEKGAFIDAKNRYEAAKIYACGAKDTRAADDAVDALFEQIELLRLQSVLDRNRADSTAEANKKQALTAYANDLAYKSKIALRDGDRNTAFRLAEFAYRYVEADNPKVVQALIDALYYYDNPNPTNPPLPRVASLEGHTGLVNSVAFSPDGKRLATGSVDNTAKIWDLESGKALATLQGHNDAVNSVAFSPDGKRLATGSDDKTAKIWDLESGKETLTLRGHTDVIHIVAFSPDGKSLATGSLDKTAKIWYLESGKKTLTLSGHTSSVYSAAFSPDGKSLATGSYDNTAKIWNLDTLPGQVGKETLTLNGHSESVSSVAFSPDGKRLATGSYDKTAKIWDLESDKETLTLRGHTDVIHIVAFSPDGKSLATGSYDNTAKIWNLDTLPGQVGKETLTLNGHTDVVFSVAFSPDGKRLATGSFDNTAKVWDLSGVALLQRWRLGGGQAGLILPQLQQYNLEALLNQHPDNENLLIATREVCWQIKAFADLAASQAASSSILSRVKLHYARADRLYAAALALQDELLIRMDYAKMLRQWAEVYQSDGLSAKATELNTKADALWKE